MPVLWVDLLEQVSGAAGDPDAMSDHRDRVRCLAGRGRGEDASAARVDARHPAGLRVADPE